MKQLLILSGKGGTGKTTIAGAFIRLARAKAFADCDVDAPNLHLVMHQASAPQKFDYYGMDKAMIHRDKCKSCGACRIHCRFDAVYQGKDGYEVDPYACEGCGLCEVVCPAGAISLEPYIAGELKLYSKDTVFSTAQLKMGSGTSGKLVTEVKKQLQQEAKKADLAIIDGSPGIGCPVIASLSGVDMVLVVAEPSLSGISDMERIISTAEKFQTKTAVCVNKYDTSKENTIKIEVFCWERNVPYAGRIPFDAEAVKAVNQGKSVVDMDCAAGKAIKEIFDNTLCILKQ